MLFPAFPFPTLFTQSIVSLSINHSEHALFHNNLTIDKHRINHLTVTA